MSNTESFLAKLEESNTRKFLLPKLQEEITYRKMDVIESTINNSMPSFLAARVLDAMKKSVGGEDIEAEPLKLNDGDIRDLLIRATEMWKKLVIEPSLNDEQVSMVPSEDRLAWFLSAISESQGAGTQGGGVLTAEEAGNFPVQGSKRRVAKRSSDS